MANVSGVHAKPQEEGLVPHVPAPRQPSPWASAAEALLRKLRGRSADDAWFELDRWGNGFLQLESGGTVILGAQSGSRASSSTVANAERRRNARGRTMPRPVSLGEVVAWPQAQRLGIAFPRAAATALPLPPRDGPATAPDDRTELSAAESERFVLMHGDNYGHLECRDASGSWRVVETLAEYMPAGTQRRYLRRVGEAYGEFQRRGNAGWESECRAGTYRQRLYLIDGKFEMLTDAEYERRHGSAIDSPSASLG